uniref:Protein FAR1-RELATED SEQUENCE n=1 Tax=Chenopodium quinoa TaxID=63459 RepID=A0A803LGV3_CHEQI
MENQVLNFDIELGPGATISDDAIEIDENDIPETPFLHPTTHFSSAIEGELLDLEPYDGMEFESEEAAKAFYNSYARRIGFSTRVSSSRRSRKDGAIIQRSFVCAKEGFRNLNEKRTKDREIKRPRMITRVGCKAMLSVKIQDSGKWVVSGFCKEHNHELVPPDQVHCLRSHRQISGPAKTLIDTLQAAGLGPRRIMSALIKEYGGISKVGFTEVDCRNYMRNNKQRSIEGDFQLLIEYLNQMKLENSGFYFAVQGDGDHNSSDFHKCVNLPESVDEFESCWLSVLDRYDLRDNEWLQLIYSARRQWVPVYLRDAFFAEMSVTQRSDSMNSYFDGYVNASTNLSQFFKLYEKALESRNEKEVRADFETISTPPALKTPSPMEKQVSGLYTRKVFMRFQEELVGTLTYMATKTDDDGQVITYQVAKYGEDHKVFCVRFNVLEMRATCSCQMFEFSGLLCRHALAVFRVTNILTLPSHYILKRWTRNAKSSVMLDNPHGSTVTSYLESHTVRYNSLRHEAFKFVDEAASTSETYDVAMAALEEAAEKVSQALKSVRKSSMANGPVKDLMRGGSGNKSSHDNGMSLSQQVSEDCMDQKIRELSEELESANRKCEVYRANLLSVLKDIEDHKQLLAVKVHNVKLSLKNAI